MNTFTVTWTVLPDGFAADGDARLSLIPTLRAATDDGRLGDSEAAHWPATVAGLGPLAVLVAGTGRRIPAQLLTPAPDRQLFGALFGPDTPVDPVVTDDGPIFAPVVTAVHYGPALQSLRNLYDEAMRTSPTSLLPADSPAARTLATLADWSLDERPALRSAADGTREAVGRLLDPAVLTAARIGEAAALLRAHGHADAAATLPLALAARRMRATGAAPAAQPPQQPSHLKDIRRLESADFHQVLGLVSDHPALALALGLRFDLRIPSMSGEFTIRVVRADGGPLPGAGPVGQPWSRVSADPGRRRFVMARHPDGPGTHAEIRNGMLDLSPEPDDRYVCTTLDVTGLTEQLRGLAAALAGPDRPQTFGLPLRRNTGIILAQTDRRSTTVEASLRATTRLHRDLGAGAAEVVLFADDVTQGYRVDVSADGGPFRSLMHRAVRYEVPRGGKLAPHVVETTDEGVVDGATMMEQRDAHGTPSLVVGEELWGWTGWGLSVPRPGRRVTGEHAGQDPVVDDPDPGLAPGFPMRMRVRPVRGTLPRLRYGRRYTFRARAVDLAGNSIEPDLCDPALVSPPVPYRRLDVIPAPALVPRAAFTPAESLTRLVVRSDGHGNPLGPACQRHLVAPRSSQHLAETHGMFDAAFGADDAGRARARDLALAVGRIEEGAFTDLSVPDPADPARRIPAQGIRVVRNEGSGPPTGTLPLPRGAALPAGEYVAHDTDAMTIPYLADPASAGVALIAPDPSPAVQVPWPGRRWPDVQPVRWVVRPGVTTGSRVVTGGPGARPVLETTVAPATEVELRLSSTVHPAMLPQFDVPLSPDSRPAALGGKVPHVSAAQPVTVVHAVRSPLAPPAVQQAGTPAVRPVGSTEAVISGTVLCHPASTGRIDIEAVWQEEVDDGHSTRRVEPRSSTTQHLTVPAGQATIAWTVRHHLGDSRRRDITYRPIGTTRYREYFPGVADGDPVLTRTGGGAAVVVPNAGRPDAPAVHSIIPVFEWFRHTAAGQTFRRRRTAGFRVYLKRPWMTTGTGERLGVVVYRTAEQGASAETEKRRVRGYVTGWATDPLEDEIPPAPALTAAAFSRRTELGAGLPLVERNVTIGKDAGGVDVVGYEVHYDTDRELWYADVALTVPDDRFPFVRLALVRFQPRSVPGCHVSPVVLTDLVQLPPQREVSVKPREGTAQIEITVAGRSLRRSTFTAVLRARVAGSAGNAVVHDGAITVLPPQVTLPDPAPGKPGTGLLTVPPEVLADPGRFDLVVVEEQSGESLHQAVQQERTVFFELVEGPALSTVLA